MPAVIDGFILSVLPYLSAWFLISGLDDLVLLALWLITVVTGKRKTVHRDPNAPEKWIAIFVPLWQESSVVRRMVTHNLTTLRYQNVAFFIGAYPNDQPTASAVREMEKRFPNVHLAMVPHDGPTSKADCLNWIHQRMLLYEEIHGAHFDAVVTHDAEDLIHPESLSWISAALEDHDMVQVPVLPLPTPLHDLIHGVYIDEFSEFQSRDLQVRFRTGGFLPSAGVGTAFSRKALEALAESASNRIFEPGCLTEDYENGFRVKALGFRQVLLPPRPSGGPEIVATREYFPRTWQAATRQRTRWVTGIVWQGIERHGWEGGARQWWWHWRDRKGLIGNPLSLLSNALFLYGLCGWGLACATGSAWRLGARMSASPAAWMWPALLSIAAVHALVRAGIVYGYYGWGHALLSPLRIPVANAINTVAALRATRRYWTAKWRGEPLVWLKTAHQYPNRASLEDHRPALEDLLIQRQLFTAEQITEARRTKPEEVPMEEWLLEWSGLDEHVFYEALSLHYCMDLDRTPAEHIAPEVARLLPAHVVRDLAVVPVRCAGGELVIGAPGPLTEQTQKKIEEYTRMPVRVALVPRSNYQEMRSRILPRARGASAAS